MEHSGEKFSETSFSDKDLTGHVFEDCSFDKCELRDAILTRTRFIDCKFKSCDLSNAVLKSATFRDVAFDDCKLLGLQWAQLATLVNPSFRESNLNYCGFVGLKLKKTTFYKCNLRETDYSQADVSESDFRESNLLNARFNGTSLLKSDFRGAKDYLIDPIANQVRGARFTLPEAQGLLAGLGVVID